MKPSRRVRAISEPLIDTLKLRARQLADAGADVINLGQALPGTVPPRAAIRGAKKALDRPETHVYTADAGIPELRALVAAHVAKHDGIRVNPDTQVIVTAGANQALVTALLCIADPGDEVLMPSPYFMNHEMAAQLANARVVEVETTARERWVISARKLARRWRRRAKGVIVTTPSNPTGAVVPRRELDRIQRLCERRGAFLILDRTYAGFEFGGKRGREPFSGKTSDSPEKGSRPLFPNTVIVGSFSKSLGMTGWRVGYLCASETLIREALKVQDTIVICAPTIGQLAVTSALRARADVPPKFLRELRRRRDYVHERIAGLKGWTAVPAAGGFFAFARIAGVRDSIAFATELLERAHVVVLPGAVFGKAGEGHIRISYGVAGIARLKKAFDRLARISGSLSSSIG